MVELRPGIADNEIDVWKSRDNVDLGSYRPSHNFGGGGCRMKTRQGALVAAAMTGVLWSQDARAQDVYCGPPPSGSTTRITSDVDGDVKVVGECTIISEPDHLASGGHNLRGGRRRRSPRVNARHGRDHQRSAAPPAADEPRLETTRSGRRNAGRGRRRTAAPTGREVRPPE
jgi:hypothetical protein